MESFSTETGNQVTSSIQQEYPEHEKFMQDQDKVTVAREFLEWLLHDSDKIICDGATGRATEDTIFDLVAAFIGVNNTAFEQEQRQLHQQNREKML